MFLFRYLLITLMSLEFFIPLSDITNFVVGIVLFSRKLVSKLTEKSSKFLLFIPISFDLQDIAFSKSPSLCTSIDNPSHMTVPATPIRQVSY